MKRVPFYRRTQARESGYKERIIWQLSKGPMTGRQLRHMLKLNMRQFYGAIHDAMHCKKVVNVERFDRYVDDLGEDWHYRLVSSPKFVAPKIDDERKRVIINPRRPKEDYAEMRRINTEKAERRARLIKAGLYIDELG